MKSVLLRKRSRRAELRYGSRKVDAATFDYLEPLLRKLLNRAPGSIVEDQLELEPLTLSEVDTVLGAAAEQGIDQRTLDRFAVFAAGHEALAMAYSIASDGAGQMLPAYNSREKRINRIKKTRTITAANLRDAEKRFRTRSQQAKYLGITERYLRDLRSQLLK
jgi:hypothetical protein